MTDSTILWRRLDVPGHEFARVGRLDGLWVLTGTALFLHEASPCRLDYEIRCGPSWETISGGVRGWVGRKSIEVGVRVDAPGRWHLDGVEVPAVADSIDLDLNFSPSTNLLPIRRLKLEVGQSGEVAAAWLRFPSFRLERLTQTYHRTADTLYRYESAGGSFARDLTVNAAGLVTRYPGFWESE